MIQFDFFSYRCIVYLARMLLFLTSGSYVDVFPFFLSLRSRLARLIRSIHSDVSVLVRSPPDFFRVGYACGMRHFWKKNAYGSVEIANEQNSLRFSIMRMRIKERERERDNK